MKYYKVISNDYIVCIGMNIVGNEITIDEYDAIMDAIRNKPISSDEYDYRLKSDMTWERYEVAIEEDPELTENEVLEILLGGDGV